MYIQGVSNCALEMCMFTLGIFIGNTQVVESRKNLPQRDSNWGSAVEINQCDITTQSLQQIILEMFEMRILCW